MKKYIHIFTLLASMFVFTTASYAQEQYQAELATLYRRFDSRDSKTISPFITELTDNRTIAYGFTGEVFFLPVDTASHPFAEAAFFERAGSVYFSIAQIEQKAGTLEGTGPELLLAVNYAKPGFPLAIQASFEESKLHYTAGSSGDLKTDRYGISLGNYFTNGLLAGVGFDRSKINDLSNPFRVIDADVLGCQLFLKYVHELDRGRGIKLEAKTGWSRTADDQRNDISSSILSMSIVYYWTQTVSTGIGFRYTGGVYVPQGQTYTANVDYFISPRFSVKGVYERFQASRPDDIYGDSNSYNITLAARF